ncbi:cytochrome c nitrite reductase small subunit [Symbiobacterium terraclitae]|uniref:Cytochrome c nitrite reductase small subunit n=1 Tax=Symbiobacterium terraclitae TaxID=557451 RepID=A0ABS4JT98_9FIRM|nr:NapC/NirT family cytochrome c [Symbiobacterium terraclitae]MBP2018738.1 cytochrome c nitrite reductase small subunit [Symbiobacterium terraclitae]
MTKRWWIIITIAAVVVIALLAGPAALTASGLEPAACATCHSMAEFRDTHAESLHASVSCSECHLPHGAAGLPKKYEKGFKHVWATVTGEADIQLKPEDEQILLDNCIACHVNTEHVSVPENRSCLNCHYDDPHGNRESRSW